MMEKTKSKPSFLEKAIQYFSAIFACLTLACAGVLNQVFHMPLSEAFLRSVLAINIGMRGIIAAAANWFPLWAENIAENYGWDKRNTYQKEIAAADCAFGCLGLTAPFFHADFWVAAILGTAICWLLSEAANISSILTGKRDSAQKMRQDYTVSKEVFAGMFVDVLMTILTLVILVVWKMRR